MSVLEVRESDICKKDVNIIEIFEKTKKTFENRQLCNFKNYKVYMYKSIKFSKCTE